jgi:hypothetical protein
MLHEIDALQLRQLRVTRVFYGNSMQKALVV